MRRLVLIASALGLAICGLVVLQQPPRVIAEGLTVTIGGADAGADAVSLDAAVHRRADLDAPAPALLLAHGFGGSRASMAEAARAWARRGYVVLTWSARGFGRSGGVIGLDDPSREIADVGVLLDLLAARPDVLLDGPGDPRAAIAGGSYGGAAALLAGASHDALDVVVAVAAWNDLPTALAPNAGGGPGVLKTQWTALLFGAGALSAASAFEGASDGPVIGQAIDAGVAALREAGPRLLLCGRFDRALCEANLRVASTGELDPAAAELLGRADVAGTLNRVQAPTLLVHHLDDTLFDLGQALANARALAASETTFALRLLPGGHQGLGGPETPAGREAAAWLSRHLDRAPDGDPPPEDAASAAAFSWVDGVSGEAQPGPVPLAPSAGPPPLVATVDGRLTADANAVDVPLVTGLPAVRPLIRPAGGLPASISVLPGLEALASLLPVADVPGQGARFETDALDADLVLLGTPRLDLETLAPPGAAGPAPPAGPAGASVDVDVDGIDVFVTLHDVTPGGSARLINSAVTPVRTDLDAPIQVDLAPVAHRLVAGNRLRLTLTTTDQAFVTSPTPGVTLLLLDGSTRLHLPTGTVAPTASLPAAVRLLIPVALVALAAALAAWATTRSERRMAGGAPPVDAAPLTDPAVHQPVVRISGLTKRYADGKVAVDGIDLEVSRGQVVGLLGPNGAGKTTTMRMLLGLISPSGGTIDVLGQRMSPGHPVLGRVGVLVEGPGFAPYLTGRQNLRSYWRSGPGTDADAAMERALEVADLGTAIDRPTRTYSHGMRQRLAIAQALLGDPELLVLDEPTDGLDPEQIRSMRQLLARLGSEGLSILVSSHLLAEVEQMCTHAVVLQSGRVIAAGSVADLVGATEAVVISTADVVLARTVLEDAVGASAVTGRTGGLEVTLRGARVADLVASLTAAGVRIDGVVPRDRLEDAFLALTSAGQDGTTT